MLIYAAEINGTGKVNTHWLIKTQFSVCKYQTQETACIVTYIYTPLQLSEDFSGTSTR